MPVFFLWLFTVYSKVQKLVNYRIFASMLKVQDIRFTYPDKTATLHSISFDLAPGEHLCVMGESGCGKSTLLKLIYGLLDLKSGHIFWKETEVLGPEHYLVPGMDFFKYVAQDFDLMPFTSVAENISKYLSRFYPEKVQKRTKELLEVIEMTAFSDVKVKNLSGGQQQRVAIARALAKEPELLLLDEPFSQIDNFKKNSLRRKLFHYLKEKNISCIVATHDGNDALSFADKLLIIKDQQCLDFDSPTALYNHPKNRYTAALFDDVNEIQFNGTTTFWYPHQISIVDHSEYRGTVVTSYFRGSTWLLEIEFNETHIFVNHPRSIPKKRTVSLEFNKKLTRETV